MASRSVAMVHDNPYNKGSGVGQQWTAKGRVGQLSFLLAMSYMAITRVREVGFTTLPNNCVAIGYTTGKSAFFRLHFFNDYHNPTTVELGSCLVGCSDDDESGGCSDGKDFKFFTFNENKHLLILCGISPCPMSYETLYLYTYCFETKQLESIYGYIPTHCSPSFYHIPLQCIEADNLFTVLWNGKTVRHFNLLDGTVSDDPNPYSGPWQGKFDVSFIHEGKICAINWLWDEGKKMSLSSMGSVETVGDPDYGHPRQRFQIRQHLRMCNPNKLCLRFDCDPKYAVPEFQQIWTLDIPSRTWNRVAKIEYGTCYENQAINDFHFNSDTNVLTTFIEGCNYSYAEQKVIVPEVRE